MVDRDEELMTLHDLDVLGIAHDEKGVHSIPRELRRSRVYMADLKRGNENRGDSVGRPAHTGGFVRPV